MRTPIKDEFTHLRISRQRKFQLRMKRDGRCEICGAAAKGSSKCHKHLIYSREKRRKVMKCKRRYYGCKSYRTLKAGA
jgi:hypothetical protein